MRPFEILLALLILGTYLALILPRGRRIRISRSLPFAAVLILLIHLVFEGYRWQMVPLYCFSAGLGIYGVVILLHPEGIKCRDLTKERKGLRWLRVSGIILTSLLLFISLLLPGLLPVPHLPEPAGPFEVGTVDEVLEDPGREEVFTADPDDRRRIGIRIWYPAEKTRGIQEKAYWERKGFTGRAYSLNSGMGSFWYAHLNRVKTNSHFNAPLSDLEKTYPVVLYSHSFYGLDTENTMLIELLASEGYVVVSIAHTYENILTFLGEDETVPGDLDYFFERYDAHAEREEALYKEFRKASDEGTRYDLVRQILGVDDQSTQLLKIRTADVKLVLRTLKKWNSGDNMFRSRLDLDRVGIMGWSFGGSTAMESCMADTTLKAGINLDGYPYGPLFNNGATMRQPYMLIQSESDDIMEEMVGRLQMERIRSQGYYYMIKGAQHTNFWDFPFFFRIYKYIDFWGPIDPLRMLEIERTYVVGFFDRYLKGLEVPDLNQTNSPIPEVKIIEANPS
ncbi:MAG: alpha/beta hydrolase family protein [Bacteroidales bacterium]